MGTRTARIIIGAEFVAVSALILWMTGFDAAAVILSGVCVMAATMLLLLPAKAVEVEDEVQKRTVQHEAATTELQRVVGELTSQNAAKVEFLAMLSHELRNPLSPIKNAIQILNNPKCDDEMRAKAQTMIDRQVTHMARLLDDLLDVARLNRGKVQLRKETADLSNILRKSLEDCASEATAKNHTIDVRIQTAAMVFGDPHRLNQVFNNLLLNAIKYTEAGGHLAVTLTMNSEWVSVSVKDDGIGMHADVLPRVFELFTQATRTLDRSKGGLGIGLALVQDLVRLHGGTVTAASDGPDKGSEFVVRLPLVKDVPAIVRGEDEPLRILVVDDNIDAADSLSMLLRSRGHDTQMVYDGVTAIKKVDVYAPDVVLLDIGLPGIDGFTCCQMLRESSFSGVVIAVTGYGTDEDRHRSQKAGFNHHLTKPVDPEELGMLLTHYGKRK